MPSRVLRNKQQCCQSYDSNSDISDIDDAEQISSSGQTNDYVQPLQKTIIRTFNKIKPGLMFYIGWIFLHHICSHLYIYYCTPTNWYGILISPFLSMTPHCNAFRWAVNESGAVFYTMWLLVGNWVVKTYLSTECNATQK